MRYVPAWVAAGILLLLVGSGVTEAQTPTAGAAPPPLLARSAEATAGAQQNPLAAYTLGLQAEAQGKLEEALAFFQRAMALDPKLERAYLEAAEMQRRLRRTYDAAQTLDRLAEVNPQNPEAEKLRERIDADVQSRIGPWDVARPSGTPRSTLELRLVVAEAEPGSPRLPDPQGEMLSLAAQPVVTEKDIVKTAIIVGSAADRFGVYVYFTPEAAQRLKEMSSAHLGGRVAILLDGKVFLAAYMHGPFGSPAMLEANYTREEATRVAERLAP